MNLHKIVTGIGILFLIIAAICGAFHFNGEGSIKTVIQFFTLGMVLILGADRFLKSKNGK